MATTKELTLTLKAHDEMTVALKNATASSRELHRALGSLEQTATKATKTMSGFGNVLFNPAQILKMSLGFAAMGSMIGLIQGTMSGLTNAMIGFNDQLYEADIAFSTMTGSAEKGRAVLEELKNFTLQTPFDFPGTLEAAKQLMAMGTAAEDLVPTLAMLGDIAAGIGRDKLPLLVLNLGQVATQGKLTGRELRDFGVEGVPMLQLLAETLGKSTAEITKMVSEGKIGFKEVRDALAKSTEEGGKFYNMMQNLTKSLGGAMSNVRDALKFAIAEGFKPMFDALTEGINLFARFLMSEDVKRFAKDVADAMATLAGAMRVVFTVLGNLISLLVQNESLMKVLALMVAAVVVPSFVMMMAPVVALVILLGTVAAAIALVIDRWNTFEQAGTLIQIAIGAIADTIKNTLRPAFEAMGNLVGNVVNFILEKFKLIAMAAQIMGGPMKTVVDMVNLLASSVDLGIRGFSVGWDKSFSAIGKVAEGTGNTIKKVIEDAKASYASFWPMIDALKARLIETITIPQGELPPIRREFSNLLPGGSKEMEEDGKAAKSVLEELLGVQELLNRENAFRVWREDMKAMLASGNLEGVIAGFEAIGWTAKNTAEEILKMSKENQDTMDDMADAAQKLASDEKKRYGEEIDAGRKLAVDEAERIVKGQSDAIRAALAKGGSLEQGLAAFAKAEWIESLETEIKKALAAGLTPDPALIQALKDGLEDVEATAKKMQQNIEDWREKLIKSGDEEFDANQKRLKEALELERQNVELISFMADRAADAMKNVGDAINDTANIAERRFKDIQALAIFQGRGFDTVEAARQAFAFAESRIPGSGAGATIGQRQELGFQRARFFTGQNIPEIALYVDSTELGRVTSWAQQTLSTILARMGVF